MCVCVCGCLAKRPKQCAPHIINTHVSPFAPFPSRAYSPRSSLLAHRGRHSYGRSHSRRRRPTFRSSLPFNRKRHFIVLYTHTHTQTCIYIYTYNLSGGSTEKRRRFGPPLPLLNTSTAVFTPQTHTRPSHLRCSPSPPPVFSQLLYTQRPVPAGRRSILYSPKAVVEVYMYNNLGVHENFTSRDSKGYRVFAVVVTQDKTNLIHTRNAIHVNHFIRYFNDRF